MSNEGLNAKIDFDSAVNELTMGFDQTDKAIKTAKRRAIGKTARHIKSKYRKMLTESLGLPKKMTLSKHSRIHMRFKKQNGKYQLWIGTDRLDSAAFGGLYQDKSGAGSAKDFFPGGFLRKGKYSGKLLIFKKVSGKLIVQKSEISKEAHAVMRKLDVIANAFFRKELINQLNYLVK